MVCTRSGDAELAWATGSPSRLSSLPMPSRTAIKVRHISKIFDLGLAVGRSPWRRIVRERAHHPFRGGSKRERLMAVDDVTFDVAEGEAVGVIGNRQVPARARREILSRITPPSGGYYRHAWKRRCTVRGGYRLHPELTGMENIYLNGTILGMSKRDIDRRLDEIIAFSEVDQVPRDAGEAL